MKALLRISVNTYKEVVRDRILYGLVVFAVLLFAFSVVLGQLSFAEQARISADFGLMAIHLSAVIIAIFVGSTLVSKELEKRTVYTILTRPISRAQFILGKVLGLSLVIFTMIIGLSAILSLLLHGLGVAVSGKMAIVVLGIFLESLVLLGFTLVFSMISKPILVVTYSSAIFLIGHWMSSLRFFTQKSGAIGLYRVIHFVLPDFEILNWKHVIVYNDSATSAAALAGTAYALAWFGLLICLVIVVFQRKDFV